MGGYFRNRNRFRTRKGALTYGRPLGRVIFGEDFGPRRPTDDYLVHLDDQCVQSLVSILNLILSHHFNAEPSVPDDVEGETEKTKGTTAWITDEFDDTPVPEDLQDGLADELRASQGPEESAESSEQKLAKLVAEMKANEEKLKEREKVLQDEAEAQRKALQEEAEAQRRQALLEQKKEYDDLLKQAKAREQEARSEASRRAELERKAAEGDAEARREIARMNEADAIRKLAEEHAQAEELKRRLAEEREAIAEAAAAARRKAEKDNDEAIEKLKQKLAAETARAAEEAERRKEEAQAMAKTAQHEAEEWKARLEVQKAESEKAHLALQETIAMAKVFASIDTTIERGTFPKSFSVSAF